MPKESTRRVIWQEMKPALFVLVALSMLGLGIHLGRTATENQCRNQNLIELEITPKNGDGTPVKVAYLCLQVTLPSK